MHVHVLGYQIRLINKLLSRYQKCNTDYKPVIVVLWSYS